MGQCKNGITYIHNPILQDGYPEQIGSQKFMKFPLLLSPEDQTQWTNNHQQFNERIHQWMLLPKKIVDAKGFFTGQSDKDVLYEWFPIILSYQIEQRNNSLNYFDEVELWYILYVIVKTGNYLYNHNLSLGHVHPNSIVMNEMGKVKIITEHSIPPHHQLSAFLAPQQLKQSGQWSRSLADSYGIGLTLLSAGILHVCDDLYQKKQIDQELLSQYLQIFGKKYSSYLYSTVHSLLETDPLQRVNSSALKIKLERYEKQIMNKEGFLPEHINKKQLNYRINSL